MEETREKSTKSTKTAENKWSVFENLQYRIPKYAITRKGTNQRKHPGNKLDAEKIKKSEPKPFEKANFVRKLTKMEGAREKSTKNTKTTTFGETSTKNKWSNFKNSQHLKAGKIKKSEPKPFQKAEKKLLNSELKTEKETIELKKKDMIKVCLFSFHFLSIF